MGFRVCRCLFSSLLRHPIFFVTLPLLLLTYCVRIITSETKVTSFSLLHILVVSFHFLTVQSVQIGKCLPPIPPVGPVGLSGWPCAPRVSRKSHSWRVWLDLFMKSSLRYINLVLTCGMCEYVEYWAIFFVCFRHMEDVNREKQSTLYCGQKWSRLRALTAHLKVPIAIKLICLCCSFSDTPRESRYEPANLESSRTWLDVSNNSFRFTEITRIPFELSSCLWQNISKKFSRNVR